MSGTKVLFIASEDEENLSVRYPAASLVQAGCPVEIAPFSGTEDTKRVLTRIRKFSPDLIAVSMAFQCRAPAFFALVTTIRSAGYTGHLTAGGHFPTFEFTRILQTQEGIDSIVRFEGEQALTGLAEFLEGKRSISAVPNLVYRDNGQIRENFCLNHFPDLDALPFPVRNARPQVRLGENFATLVSSRGCWHSSCAYCCIGAFHAGKTGKRHALRSVENVAREIAWLYHEQDVRLFQFHDDNFLQAREEENLKRINGLQEALRQQGVDCGRLAFLIKARPDSITESVAQCLDSLGVVGVFLGVENASESGLRALIRGSKVRHIGAAFDILKKHRIVVTYNLLMFHPDATLDEINENIRFLKDHPEYPSDFGRAEIVAGSPLERYVLQENLLLGNWPNWDYQIKDPDVDRMFRISLATFRRRDSGYSRLAHSMIALAYGVHVVRRLYPGPVAEEIYEKSDDLIRKSNAFVIDTIFTMYELTAGPFSTQKADHLANSVREGCHRLAGEAEDLSRRMNRLQVVEKKFQNTGIADTVQHSVFIRSLFWI